MSDNLLLPEDAVSVSIGGGLDGAEPMVQRRFTLPPELPLLAVKDMSMFPRMVLPMLISDPRHQQLVDQVLNGDKLVGLVALKGDTQPEDVKSLADLGQVGVAALILQMAKSEEGGLRLVAQGLTRFRVSELTQVEPYLKGRVVSVKDILTDDLETKALVNNLRALFRRVLELAPHLPDELNSLVASVDEPGALCDMVASAMNLNPDERQGIVEALEVKERLRLATTLLNREIQVLELGSKIQDQVKEGLDKTQREYYLRQQLKAIKEELGEQESGDSETDGFRQRLKDKKLPEQVRAEAERELGRLEAMHSSSAEYHVITTYLDWILNLPWEEATEDHLDIKQARAILNKDHYDLDKVKRRILEYLAVRKLNPDMKGPILCFVGPPGVGKTSLGRSIARALGRNFQRISLGGVRDEAEIRGHRRTYVGAMPGRIVQSLRRAGSMNPVFMLDEVDKVGADFRGDPSSALLEVLDPEQNFSFSDHYLDLPFDLSKVMFITTANVLDTIPPPLRDRMEIIEIPGYIAEDKLKIAKRYLVPRQRSEHGLSAKQLSISDAAIKLLITGYTREAGLRNLEREIGSLCRWAARAVAEGEKKAVKIGKDDVADILGPQRIVPDTALRTAVPGVATGLAWTPTGGDILFVEASRMPGKGALNLTGQLGEVMKESAQAAVTYLRANANACGLEDRFAKDTDIHVHVPAGAIPKDGPSAGVTLFAALLSLFSGRPVRSDLAMTGEITLRGMVLPVGGIKEKVLAAHRAGIKTVILPAANERDLVEVPDNVKKKMSFKFAQRIDQVADWALEPAKKKAKPKATAKAAPKSGNPKAAKAAKGKKAKASGMPSPERKAARKGKS
ncbi:MAG: endopeptidase La [Desulfarculaceae bacterium]|nr:endopeptidase La [Desulfarculaceae bacterium]MCF8074227.1 endopeptidase La [Desulfarculaceae bacterium]MCF8103014.1 endopeptidase La [Desulfarculaceae bacterium]MCF8117145.1 endopeptidase La [Desulfarculaceae bacterium]